MNLGDYDLKIGTVVNVNDPQKLNMVQCAVPFTQDVREDSINENTMFWVKPFTMSGYQSYSKAQKGAKVWILQNKNNRDECWYLNFWEPTDSLAGYIEQNDDAHPEVIFLRKFPDKIAKISYDDNNGLELKNGNTYIRIKEDGSIELGNNAGGIVINGNNINMGSNNLETQPTVLANNLIEIMNKISMQYEQLYRACMGSRYLIPIAKYFYSLKDLNSDSSTKGIKTQNTSVT